jgi:hypothetical protein
MWDGTAVQNDKFSGVKPHTSLPRKTVCTTTEHILRIDLKVESIDGLL